MSVNRTCAISSWISFFTSEGIYVGRYSAPRHYPILASGASRLNAPSLERATGVKTSIRFFDDGPPYSACGSVLSVSPVSKNRRFDFDKRSQLFIRTHNETLSVVAMRVSNPDYSPARIHG